MLGAKKSAVPPEFEIKISHSIDITVEPVRAYLNSARKLKGYIRKTLAKAYTDRFLSLPREKRTSSSKPVVLYKKYFITA